MEPSMIFLIIPSNVQVTTDFIIACGVSGVTWVIGPAVKNNVLWKTI
jgi:hypothetical protein